MSWGYYPSDLCDNGSPHQHKLLHRAEIRHCSSGLDVLYDVVFF